MSTAPRFRRERPVQQYGSADVKHMTPEEIAAAYEEGHLDNYMAGGDVDAPVQHDPDCTNPNVQTIDPGKSRRMGDRVDYACTTCNATGSV